MLAIILAPLSTEGHGCGCKQCGQMSTGSYGRMNWVRVIELLWGYPPITGAGVLSVPITATTLHVVNILIALFSALHGVGCLGATNGIGLHARNAWNMPMVFMGFTKQGLAILQWP